MRMSASPVELVFPAQAGVFLERLGRSVFLEQGAFVDFLLYQENVLKEGCL